MMTLREIIKQNINDLLDCTQQCILGNVSIFINCSLYLNYNFKI